MIDIVADPSKKIRYYFRVNSTPLPKTIYVVDEAGNPYPVNTKTWQVNLKRNAGDSTNVVQLLSGSGLTIGVNSITIAPSQAQVNIQPREYFIEVRNVTDAQSWFTGIAKGHEGEFDNFETDALTITVTNANGGTILIDQTGASDYGALGGVVNGVNTTFTVSNGTYTSGTLIVYRNGVAQTAGEFAELSPSAGTFQFVTAPLSGDVITAVYGVNAIQGVRVQPNNNFIFVDTKSDLPAAVAGVITLQDEATYFFTSVVDLTGDRLVAGQNTTILGGSSENSRIKSTGLNAATALITSNWSLPMRSITIEHGTALNLDASSNANQALDWFGVNFTDCATIGTIKSYNNFIATDCGVLNSANWTFDGTIGTVGFISCIFDGRAGQSILIVPATATITRRFRAIYSAFISLSGETSLNISASASIPVEGYILDTCNFSGGGTYVSGLQHTDNKSLFVNNRGISNSAEISYYTMNGNATATTISLSNTAYKVAGTTVSQAITQKFTNTNNRATFTGAITRTFKVTAILSCTSGNNHQIGVYIAKNGSVQPETESYITTGGTGRAEGAKVQGVVSLAQNEFVEIFIENATSATNITVQDLSVIIEALN